MLAQLLHGAASGMQGRGLPSPLRLAARWAVPACPRASLFNKCAVPEGVAPWSPTAPCEGGASRALLRGLARALAQFHGEEGIYPCRPSVGGGRLGVRRRPFHFVPHHHFKRFCVETQAQVVCTPLHPRVPRPSPPLERAAPSDQLPAQPAPWMGCCHSPGSHPLGTPGWQSGALSQGGGEAPWRFPGARWTCC